MENVQLATNFWLNEFVESDDAKEHGIDNTPNQKHIDNLRHLCTRVLQPIRDFYGAEVVISSGFRAGALNKMVGGSKSSHHRCFSGYAAADFSVRGVPLEDVVLDLQRAIGDPAGNPLPYEQLIFEPGWIHLSSYRPRRQYLKATRVDGTMIYSLV